MSADMGQCAVFAQILEELGFGDMRSTLREVLGDLLDTPDPPMPPPSSPPVVPAGTELDIHPQLGSSMSGGYDVCTDLRAAPHGVEQQSLLHSPAGPRSRGQEFIIHPQLGSSLSGGYDGCTLMGAAPHNFEQPNPFMAAQRLNVGQAAPIMHQGGQNVLQPGPLYHQAAAHSQGQYNNVPAVQLSHGVTQSLHPVGVLDGQLVYELKAEGFTPFNSSTFQSKKREREEDQQVEWPYVKKPPNAFMIFMEEQRSNVQAEANTNWMSVTNAILGQRWKSLSKEEQAKYYEAADKKKRLHAQLHPDWSPSDNYGKKRRRNRSLAAKRAEGKTACFHVKTEPSTSSWTRVMEPSTSSWTCVTEPSTSSRSVMEAPPPQTVHIQYPPAAPAESQTTVSNQEDRQLDSLLAELLEPVPLAPQEAQNVCVSPVSTGVKEAPPPQMQHPHTDISVTVDLSNENDFIWTILDYSDPSDY